MAVTFEASGNSLKLTNGNQIKYLPADDIKIEADLGDNSLVLYLNGKIDSRYLYSEITSPSGADIESKSDAINLLLQNRIDGKSTTGTLYTIAATSTSAQYIAENTNRLCVVINNATSRTLYLKYTSGASSTSYIYRLASNDYVEIENYNGAIYGALNSGTGSVLITELT